MVNSILCIQRNFNFVFFLRKRNENVENVTSTWHHITFQQVAFTMTILLLLFLTIIHHNVKLYTLCYSIPVPPSKKIYIQCYSIKSGYPNTAILRILKYINLGKVQTRYYRKWYGRKWKSFIQSFFVLTVFVFSLAWVDCRQFGTYHINIACAIWLFSNQFKYQLNQKWLSTRDLIIYGRGKYSNFLNKKTKSIRKMMKHKDRSFLVRN